MQTGYRKITDIDDERVLRLLTRRFNARGVAWRLESHSRGFTRVFVLNTQLQLARSLCNGLVAGALLLDDGGSQSSVKSVTLSPTPASQQQSAHTASEQHGTTRLRDNLGKANNHRSISIEKHGMT